MTKENQIQHFLKRYFDDQAERSGYPAGTQAFSLSEDNQRSTEKRIAQAVPFLNAVNNFGVANADGAKLRPGLFGAAAKRTDVTAHDLETDKRFPLTDEQYHCKSTEYDVSVPWVLLDSWGRDRSYDEFEKWLDSLIIYRQAKDRILTGWHGTSAAAETDPVANPTRADLNVSWLQQIRDNAPGQVIAKPQTFGSGGDFTTLNALVKNAINSKLPAAFQGDHDLRVFIGPDLLPDGATDSDGRATLPRIAGRRVACPPFFPAGKVLLTAHANLSLYWKIGLRNQFVEGAPQSNRYDWFTSSDDAYVVEDHGFAALIDDVTAI